MFAVINKTPKKPTENLTQDESVENVIRRADEAMYAAKQAGRNSAVIFVPEE